MEGAELRCLGKWLQSGMQYTVTRVSPFCQKLKFKKLASLRFWIRSNGFQKVQKLETLCMLKGAPTHFFVYEAISLKKITFWIFNFWFFWNTLGIFFGWPSISKTINIPPPITTIWTYYKIFLLIMQVPISKYCNLALNFLPTWTKKF